jgi:RNA polymerase sigma-70 factor (ECF subfamily)
VSPEWTIRVGGRPGEPAGYAQWAEADDRTLVAACLAHHREAFDVIVERHRRQVYQLCYRYVGNHEDAADLAQDVFIRAFKGLRGFKGHSSLATWLYRIAINVCLNRVSLKTPRPEALDPRDREDLRAERPDLALLRHERASEVRAAIRRLPRKQRATLILRVYHELPHEQIAAILGSSVGAAKANFFHALANLKKMLR